ncbi:hypothetical protein RPIT_10480 [Tessaracoccus flavus]|uniref:Uncharacterized protein n=2 Tax=Tessaracoccus flavus TaxID=1610493 RepID=A0A1Q2CJ67_9ACTN|nr:hypothetical protein RPIT_10480 [Tessaracoccus flavus]SDY54418.1 iron complex transport system permease protein [Tessaracoccus flavus]
MPAPNRLAIVGALCLAGALGFLLINAGGNLGFVMELRSKKMLGMIVVGWATGIATVAFQTVTHNRLLTPSIMGLDSMYVFIQSLLAITLGVTFIGQVGVYPMFALNIALMMLAMMGLIAVLFRGKRRSVYVLVLTGLVLGTVLRSASSLIQRMLDPTSFLVLQGNLFASFQTVNPELLWVSGAIVAAGSVWLFRLIPELDVITLGREAAVSLGVRYDSVVRQSLLIGTLLVSVSTALVGPITFLGLIVAALAHQIGGSGRHAVVLPMAGLLGVLLLVGGQAILEQVFGLGTVLSVIIEFVGGIVFIWLVVRKVSRT